MRTILATAAAVVALSFNLGASDISKERGEAQARAMADLRDGMSLSLDAMTAARHRWPAAQPVRLKTAAPPAPRTEQALDREELRQAVTDFLNNGGSVNLASQFGLPHPVVAPAILR